MDKALKKILSFLLRCLVSFLVLSLITVIVLLLFRLFISNLDIDIPSGYTEAEEHWDQSGSQDRVDFCMYKYDSDKRIASNSVYSRAAGNDIERISGYFESFREYMEANGRLDEYTFDTACISEEDYYCISTKEGMTISDTAVYGPFDNYTVYFFDTDTLTLYYIHANI